MKKTILSALAGTACMLTMLSAPAQAGPDKVRAEAYFNAISGGNAETITSFYSDNAEFHWVGGPLAGTYQGKRQIKGVWEKFTKAAGDIDHKVLELSESQNGKRSTVTARVNFIGPKTVPVKFIMIYENGKIVSEVWQVDKAEDYAKAAAPAQQAAATKAQPEAAGGSEAEQRQAARDTGPEAEGETEAAAPPAESAARAPASAAAPAEAGPAEAAPPVPPVSKATAPTDGEGYEKPKKKPVKKHVRKPHHGYAKPYYGYWGHDPYYGHEGYGYHHEGYGHRRHRHHGGY